IDDAAAAIAGGFLVTLDHAGAFHLQLAFSWRHSEYATALSFVAAGDNDHLIVLLNLCSLRSLQSFPSPRRSDNFRRQRNDFHVVFVAQLTRHGSEHAGADWRSVFFDQHRRVLIESNIGSVAPTNFFACPHDDGVLHGALLDRAVGRSFLHCYLDSIAETGNRASRAAD